VNIIPCKGKNKVVVIGLAPGEMLLESIREAVRTRKIEYGAVVPVPHVGACFP
jgi:hypothetical protein